MQPSSKVAADVTTGTILDEIIAHKHEEVARDKDRQPPAEVRRAAASAVAPRDFLGALRAPGISLIAEVKRASPSAGTLNADLDPAVQARTYERHGAAAVSVLTDRRYFRGSLEDLQTIHGAVSLPVLRKDFIVDPYQVLQARAYGADAILLIVAALRDTELRDLQKVAHDLGLAALVEVHNREELNRALAIDPQIVGINNRDLRTFEVTLDTTAALRPYVPERTVLVAESGIQTPEDVHRLRAMGVDAMLVGTALVATPDTAAMVQSLVTAGKQNGE